MPPDFKLYYEAYNVQTLWVLAQKKKHRLMEQNRNLTPTHTMNL